MNNTYSIYDLKVIFYLCTALFLNFIRAEQGINAPYYDNCGNFDNIPDNDCKQDCFGIWGGDSILDECGVCGGKGPQPNKDCNGECIVEIDCFGICVGKALIDDCGKCDEDPTNDCKKSYFDKCGNFDDDPTNDCVKDCAGIWGGLTKIDDCGICGGENSSCGDCAGVANGKAYYDKCNICDDNPENDCVKDCTGIWGGNNILDNCGICGGDNKTSEYSSGKIKRKPY